MRPNAHPVPLIVKAFLTLSFVAASTYVSGKSAQDQEPVEITGSSAVHQAADESRFPIALQHSGSWCYGYLYVGRDRVRFEVVRPQSDSKYFFDVARTDVSVRQLVLLGLPQDEVELKAKGVTYHLLWLADEREVNSGAPRRWGPPISQAPDALIAAVQNAAVLTQSKQEPGDPLPDSNFALPQPAKDRPSDVSSGKLAAVYVATAGIDARPTNTQYLFYPDGFVMNGIPQGGMLNFDFEHCRQGDNPDRFTKFGRYKVEGEEIKIVWLDQYADPASPHVIKHNETSAHPSVEVGPQVFIPMCHCTGKMLSGTYRWGAPAADQHMQFFADGTFIDHRVTDQLVVPSRFYEHPRIQRGTYEIRQQTIIFSFADGHRATRTFLAPKVQENNPTFDWIDLGWQMLFEEGYREKLSQ